MRAEFQKLRPSEFVVRTSRQIAIYLIVPTRFIYHENFNAPINLNQLQSQECPFKSNIDILTSNYPLCHRIKLTQYTKVL